MSDDLAYPDKRSPGDLVHTGTEAALGAIPVLGGPIATIVAEAWTPTLERRRVEWLNQLSEDVGTLAGEIGDIEERLKDEAVLDVAMRAAEAALRTRDEGKRRRLRAAVLNAATGKESDIEQAEIFVRLIDQFTEAHLVMLSFLDGPEVFAEQHGRHLANITAGGLMSHINAVFPQWSEDFVDRIVADLDQARLTQGNTALRTMMTYGGTVAQRTSPAGRRFLQFVTHPLDG